MFLDGASTFSDMPVDLLRAVFHAFKILDWFDNLMEEEIPPEWMWSFDDELVEWFENVKEEREARYGGSSVEKDDRTEVPLMENELASGRR